MFKKLNELNVWRKYHKIESFTIALCLILCVLVVDLAGISIHIKNSDRDALTNQAIYVSDFTTSLSCVKGNIAQVYTNPTNTKCAVLLYFSDMSHIVSDALQYQVFVKGFNVAHGKYASKTLSNPTGGYYIFGSTGYSLIYLVDNNGFQNQALELIVRCNDTIFESPDSSKTTYADSSYTEYDQFRLIVNPCGALATKVDFLDDFDAVSLYQHAVVTANENRIRDTLTNDVSQLQVLMKKIIDYRTRLEGNGVRVPEVPEMIVGDSFVEEGEGASKQLIYVPDTVFSNGVSFDWYHTDLLSGSFLTDELLGVRTPLQFFADLENAVPETEPKLDKFYKLDGTPINENVNADIAELASISSDLSSYRTAISDYYKIKKQYQSVDLVNYLKLEYNMMTSGQHFTSNYSDNAVIVW